MEKRLLWVISSFLALLLTTACDTALTVGSKTVGIRSGELIYTDGYLRATYLFPMDTVWEACERTLTSLKATDIERLKQIATGTITAMVQEEKVRISVQYVERGMTSVSVMIGSSGNNLAAQLIHDRIGNNLKSSMKHGRTACLPPARDPLSRRSKIPPFPPLAKGG
jgi:hypothetical protein